MSEDARVTKSLIQTLEDGKEGFAKGAEKLAGDGSAELAETFRTLSTQRAQFSAELEALAADYGDDIDESGTVAGALHRGWMTLKDALTGNDPRAVLDVAAQGEDHAVKEFKKALDGDLSADLRSVVARQAAEVQEAHDRVRALRDAHA